MTQKGEELKKRLIEKEELKKEGARKLSIIEGSYASVASGTGHSYVAPFALALGASSAQVGVLSSLPGIVGPLAQLFGSRLMEKAKRKKIVAVFVFFEALLWLPILALSLMAYFGFFKNYLPVALIVLYSLLYLIGNLASPAWFSWMGDLVPERIRGRYFSDRNRICGTVALISMLLASFLLDYFKTHGLVLFGFALLFFAASIARLVSSYCFTKKYEPKMKLKKGYYFTFRSFIRQMPFNNFGRFTILVSLTRLSVFIAAPFFAVYMLRNLQFSYFWFMAVTVSGTIFTLIFMPLFGRFSDKYGNRALLKIGICLIPVVPILWIFSKNPVYLILIPELIAGVGWAAFNLGANNFIYDSVSPQRRGICIAYHNVIVGAGILAGGLIGSFMAKSVSVSFMSAILFIFLVSGVARALVGIYMLGEVEEIRRVRKPKRMAKAVFMEAAHMHFIEGLKRPALMKFIFPMHFLFKKDKQ